MSVMYENETYNETSSVNYIQSGLIVTTFIPITMYGFISSLISSITSCMIINRKKNFINQVNHFKIQRKRMGLYLLYLSIMYLVSFSLQLILDLQRYFKYGRNIFGIFYFVRLIVVYGEIINRIFFSWILVAISFETLYTTIFYRPEITRVYKIFSPKFVPVIILLFIVPINIFAISSIYFIFKSNETLRATSIDAQVRKNITIGFVYILFNSIIPYILIGICIKILIKKILKRKPGVLKKKRRKFIKRIIFMNLPFFICNLIFYSSFFYTHYCKYGSNESYLDYCGKDHVEFYSNFSIQVEYVNRASLFLIFFMTNKLFRKEFKSACCKNVYQSHTR
jgi:hypothetical protein